jgi:hypothetical protein
MVCEREWRKFENSLRDFIARFIDFSIDGHKCWEHRDKESCDYIRRAVRELDTISIGLSDSIAELSKCLGGR